MVAKITWREHSGVSAVNKHLRKKLNGQFIVIWTVAIVALLGAMALCTDVAVIYYNYVKLQKAADTGALAGANYLVTLDPAAPTVTPAPGCTNAGGDAQDVACTYAAKNAGSNADGSGPPVWTDANFQTPAPDAPAGLPTGTQTIEVTLTRDDIPAFFSRAVGWTKPFKVTVKAVAAIGTLGSGCIWPAGLSPDGPTGAPWNYGDPLTLYEGKVNSSGQWDVGPGNWEWLNIGGPGAKTLEQEISGNGCTQLSVGDQVTPDPGEKWGPISSALGTLLANGPVNVLVPIVDWTGAHGASTPIPVLGFAVIELTSFGKQGNDVHLNATFIKTIAATTGAPGPNPYDAYIVWLVK
jgi:Putative Flp pilus-assembly TadE/G-like